MCRDMAMNDFDLKAEEILGSPLTACDIAILQVNVGLRCNNSCMHCHVDANPTTDEMMDWETMQLVIDVAHKIRPELVDITGGAPELNPHLRNFVSALRKARHSVQVRTNLTILLEPGMDRMMRFYRDSAVSLVASLPCYLKPEVDSQRGEGVFDKSIEALKRLNDIGYGMNPELRLDLVFNPQAAFLPPEQSSLETEYRETLDQDYGIVFNRVITLTNMPIGRFQRWLRQEKLYEKYDRLLRDSFNPQTLDKLMCRHQVEVGWDGRLYDCDFNLALRIHVDYRYPIHVKDFDVHRYSKRRIVTGEHCFGCTAGHGSSCGGALVA
jgi:radical SAM/Cys-rich protein